MNRLNTECKKACSVAKVLPQYPGIDYKTLVSRAKPRCISLLGTVYERKCETKTVKCNCLYTYCINEEIFMEKRKYFENFLMKSWSKDFIKDPTI